MEIERYLLAAREQVTLFAGTVHEAVSGYIMGGWRGVLMFALAITVMFVLTSLLSPRR
jgi:tetrahydromethanopterin S-methyltransferase subunit B